MEPAALVGGLVQDGLPMLPGVAEVALVADPAAIRIDGKEVVEQELEETFSSGPADRRVSTAWTNGGSH
jgi:hypothetical protein